MDYVSTVFKFIISLLGMALMISIATFAYRQHEYDSFVDEVSPIIATYGGVNSDSQKQLDTIQTKYHNFFIATPPISAINKNQYQYDNSTQNQGFGRTIKYNVHTQIPYVIMTQVAKTNAAHVNGVFTTDTSNIVESQKARD